MIWLNLIIPALFVIGLAIFAHKKMAWWEYCLQFFVAVLAIFIAKEVAVGSMTKDKEYWNNYAVSAEYTEAWDEYIHKTCSRQSCSGSGKNQTCTTTYYDCSYVEDYPEYWTLYDNAGGSHSIDKSFYKMLVQLWKNEKFVDMNRDYHSYDGDRYATQLGKNPKNLATIIPITTTHTYENRTQVPSEVFNFQEVDSLTIAQYGLYDYTWRYDRFGFKPIKGDNHGIANKKLAMHNALNGRKAELHTEILVFDNKPSMAGEWQKAYWKGGNKNEFIICIGKKDGKVDWVNVFSWTTNEQLKVDVKNTIAGMGKYDINKIVDYVTSEVHPKFTRREFKEFSYITVNPSTNAVIWTFVITLIISSLLAGIHIENDIGLGGQE